MSAKGCVTDEGIEASKRLASDKRRLQTADAADGGDVDLQVSQLRAVSSLEGEDGRRRRLAYGLASLGVCETRQVTTKTKLYLLVGNRPLANAIIHADDRATRFACLAAAVGPIKQRDDMAFGTVVVVARCRPGGRGG